MKEEPTTFITSARSYSLGVLLSRISGMIRDVVLAYSFGTSASISLFMLSYRLSNIFRRVLTETPLSSSFIPLYQSLREKSPSQGLYFFRDLCWSFSLILSFLIALVSFLGITLSQYYLTKDASRIVFLTSLMLPSLFFLFIYGIFSALLQSHRSFFITSAAPIAFNLCWIVPVLLMRSKGFCSLNLLALCVVLGFALQAFFLFYSLKGGVFSELSGKEWLKPRFFSSSVKSFMKPFCLTALGVATTQINAAADGFFAKAASSSGPAFLWYAIRIEQLPIALFGVSLAASILPFISRYKQTDDRLSIQTTINNALDQMMGWMSLSMWGLIIFGPLGLNLIFGRGAFTLESLKSTYLCLIGYAFGVIPHGICLLYTSALHGLTEFKTPAKISFYTILFHFGCNTLFVLGLNFGAFSVALSTSLSSFLQMIMLKRSFDSTLANSYLLSHFLRYLMVGILSSALAAASCYKAFYDLFVLHKMLTFTAAFIHLSIGGGVFILAFVVFERLFGLDAVYKQFRLRAFK